jgi:hypothetical protein
VSSKTGPDGTVQMTVPADKKQRAVINVNGKDLVSEPFEVAKSGGKLDAAVRWEAKGRPQVLFDVPYKPDLVVYAETRFAMPSGAGGDDLFRSRPVQLVEGTGVHIPLTIYPRVLINFKKIADVEDEYLYVRGQYTIENISWAPYSAGPDGMVIPLPSGFKGGKVVDEHQSIASIAPGEGLRIVRPLAPGRTQVRIGYSLVSHDGVLDWHLDIKQYMLSSEMQIRLHNDMAVKPNLRAAEGSTPGRLAAGGDGAMWHVFDDITIRAGQSMEFTVTGMPSPPEWRVWVPRLIGVLVLGIIVAGAVFALLRRPAPVAPSGDKRRQALLDELVEIDRSSKDPARREQVLAELERLWRE